MPSDRIDHDLPTYQHNPVVLRLADRFMQRIRSRRAGSAPSESIRAQATAQPSTPADKTGRDESTVEPLGLPSEPAEPDRELVAELQRIHEQAQREQRRNGR